MTMKKKIPMNKIVVEKIDPFLAKNQIIDVTSFDEVNVKVTFYYHYKKDCLMIKVEQDSIILFHEMGARPSYNSIVAMLKDALI
jgi:hypothetical protein